MAGINLIMEIIHFLPPTQQHKSRKISYAEHIKTEQNKLADKFESEILIERVKTK